MAGSMAAGRYGAEEGADSYILIYRLGGGGAGQGNRETKA